MKEVTEELKKMITEEDIKRNRIENQTFKALKEKRVLSIDAYYMSEIYSILYSILGEKTLVLKKGLWEIAHLFSMDPDTFEKYINLLEKKKFIKVDYLEDAKEHRLQCLFKPTL